MKKKDLVSFFFSFSLLFSLFFYFFFYFFNIYIYISLSLSLAHTGRASEGCRLRGSPDGEVFVPSHSPAEDGLPQPGNEKVLTFKCPSHQFRMNMAIPRFSHHVMIIMLRDTAVRKRHEHGLEPSCFSPVPGIGPGLTFEKHVPRLG